MKRFKNAQIYTGQTLIHGGFAVDRGRFSEVGPEAPDAVDLGGALVLPSLIDIHTHGNSGHDFSDGDYEGLKTMAAFYAHHGVTSFAPASMTLSEDVLAKAYETAVRLHREQPDGCAVLRGIQMEGPFFAESKKGAQNGDYLRAPDAAMFHRLTTNSPQLLWHRVRQPPAVGLSPLFQGTHGIFCSQNPTAETITGKIAQLSIALRIRLNITALPLAPLGVLANRKFFQSITKGLILRSARLLEISSLPPFR